MSSASAISNIIESWKIQHKIEMVKNNFVFKVPPLIIESPSLLQRGNSQQKVSKKKSINLNKFTCGFKEQSQRKEYQETISNPNSINNFLLNKSFKQNPQEMPFLLIDTDSNFTKTTPLHRYEEDQAKLLQIKKQSHLLSAFNLPNIKNQINKEKDSKDVIKENKDTKDINKRSLVSVSETKKNIPNNLSLETASNNYSAKTYRLEPLRIIQPSKILHKGYLPYDPQVKEFWEKKLSNLKNKPNKNNKLNIVITARSYVVLDYRHLVEVSSRNSQVYIEIASLTKIMTCYLCILACRKYQIDINTYLIRVSDRAAEMSGTSAQLQAGDLISIKTLLYGLMLPSGNDASVALAQGIGRIIDKFKKNGLNANQKDKSGYQTFINQMNSLARELQIDQEYSNSSGLSFNPNFSTPLAIAILSVIAMRNQIFRSIVNTKEIQVEVKNQRYGLSRKIVWKNTNKLLWKGWEGVKTGTTQTAGHCLLGLKKNYVVGVFDCDTLSKRFTQCIKIYDKLIVSLGDDQQQQF